MLAVYHERRPTRRKKDVPFLDGYCFMAAYTHTMMTLGLGFEAERNITVAKVVRGEGGGELKVGWALGAMLYEINALPWRVSEEGREKEKLLALEESGSWFYGVPLEWQGLLGLLLGLAAGVAVGTLCGLGMAGNEGAKPPGMRTPGYGSV